MTESQAASSSQRDRGDFVSSLTRYGFALLVSAACLAATFSIPGMRGRPYILSGAGLLVSAWLGGAGPTFLTMVATFAGVNAYTLAFGSSTSAFVHTLQTLAFLGVGVLVMSVTRARAASEREARRQSARLEAMFRQASVGIAMVNLDGRPTRMNARMAEIIGRPVEDAGTLSIQSLIHPDDRSGHAALVEKVIQGTLKQHAVDTRYVRPDGSQIWVHESIAPMMDADERLEGLVVIVEDVSERRQQDDKLRASEDRYRSLVDATTAIVWTAGADGGFQPPQESWSAITGQQPDAFAGWGWSQALHPDDRERIEQLWRESLSRSLAVDTEVRIWNAGVAGYRWYSARVVPRRDAGGRVVEWVGACTDIHERRLAEIQLRESDSALRRADREKDNFLALLAHELRNPLAPIRTAVQLLRMRAQPGDDSLRLHAVIERQVQHLVRMVDDLLDVSRVVRGKVDLRLATIDVAEVVAAAVETARPLIDAERQQLTISLPRPSLFLRGDHVRLSQVVSNLLNNASKYTPRGGAIELTVQWHDGGIVIGVRDTGAGIPADVLPRIFEPFVQADRTLERSRGGLGIGLTLVRQVVELHGGRVTATSAGGGLGSQFDVWLPSIEVAEQQATAAAPPQNVAMPLRLLVVDDNRDAAETLAMLLEANGHQVEIAHNGNDALALVARSAPDVVILDIGLPGMSGYEIAATLRQTSESCPPLIALTGYGEPSHLAKAQESGFLQHLVKPIDAADLMAAIAHCRDRVQAEAVKSRGTP